MNEIQKLIIGILKSSPSVKFDESFIKKAFKGKYQTSDFLNILSKNYNSNEGIKGSELVKILSVNPNFKDYQVSFIKNNFSPSQISKIKTEKQLERILDIKFNQLQQRLFKRYDKLKQQVIKKSEGGYTFAFTFDNMSNESFSKLSIKEKINVLKQYKNELDSVSTKDKFINKYDKYIVQKIIYIQGIGRVPTGWDEDTEIQEKNINEYRKKLNKYFKTNKNFSVETELEGEVYLIKKFYPKINYTKKQKRIKLKSIPWQVKVVMGVKVNPIKLTGKYYLKKGGIKKYGKAKKRK